MVKKRSIPVLLILYLYSSYAFPQEVRKIMVDPLNAMGGAASRYFETVDFIPLQTTKESIFGKIDKLQVTPRYFIILDKTTDAILFFNKDGSYHHKIAKLTFDKVFAAPNQEGVRFSTIVDFQADPETDNIYVSSIFERGAALYIFDQHGKRMGKIKFPVRMQDGIVLKDGVVFYKQWFLMLRDQPGNDPFHDVAYSTDTSSSNLHYLFPTPLARMPPMNDMSIHISYFKSATGDSICMYTPDMDYNVYELGKNGVKNQYQLLLPQQLAVPPGFATDSTYNGKRTQYITDNKVIPSIFGAYKTGDYLLFDIRIPERTDIRGGIYTLLYSLKTSRLVTLDRISADDKTYQLPVSGPQRSELLAAEPSGLYFSYSSLMMFNLRESIGNRKHPPYNKALDNYFKTQDRKSNPVLIRLQPKSNI